MNASIMFFLYTHTTLDTNFQLCCIELEIEGKVIHIIIFLGNLKACWKEIFEKYSVLQMKLVADLLENHPFSFLPVMKEALNVIC